MHSFIALLLRPYTKAFLYSRTTDAQRGNSLHCTEVKKGEINYSEILLFQPSLGYF